MPTDPERMDNLRRGNATVKFLPCSVCGEPVPIPIRYGHAKKATHASCRDKV